MQVGLSFGTSTPRIRGIVNLLSGLAETGLAAAVLTTPDLKHRQGLLWTELQEAAELREAISSAQPATVSLDAVCDAGWQDRSRKSALSGGQFCTSRKFAQRSIELS
eukprot:TRINITY_DN4203_c2_g1_i1.p2 TRINITY_DN4203_c2_g1~~TRINITY_DN4203_c2_g1_i1.p2  ORF type:complete len:107 (+),score=5.22 TRINITY_DN4203_c2_g1_i1:80-400(+)